jgi:hypothetical protein
MANDFDIDAATFTGHQPLPGPNRNEHGSERGEYGDDRVEIRTQPGEPNPELSICFCPRCEGRIQNTPEIAETVIDCPHCHQPIELPHLAAFRYPYSHAYAPKILLPSQYRRSPKY